MKSTSVKFGLIAGLILAVMIFIMSAIVGKSSEFERAEIIGNIFMIAAFVNIFLGIRELRDKKSGGVISFNTAFRTGIVITIIGSLCYVTAWMIYFNYVDDTFVERYTEFYISKLHESGKSPAEIEKEITGFKQNMAEYKHPAKMASFTFLEIFPIGLVISVLCAFLMKKKPVTTEPEN